MGIEGIFNSLMKNNVIKTADGIITGIEKKLDCNYLYIDFTSILYSISNSIDNDIGYLLYSIISNKLDKKAILIAKKWDFKLKNATIETYKNFFISHTIEHMIELEVEVYLLFILTKLVKNDDINIIYIGMDGIPQMSKIIEQKKRRYMGTIVSDLKKTISINYFDNEKLPKISQMRALYEKYKVYCDRNKFLASSDFMNNIGILLNSKKINDLVKKICLKLTDYIVSDTNIGGEGEKKIMEHILANKYEGNTVIFSPDGDLIVLGIIASNIINNTKFNLSILRYNQQSNEFDTINIDTLNTNMFEYINKLCYLKNNKKVVLDKNNVGFDIAILITLFGNDFIPKLESINVKNDINILFDYYCEIITDNYTTNPYFVIIDKTYKLNNINLFKLFEKISRVETRLLQSSYLTNLSNYKFIKSVFSSDILADSLLNYIEYANEVYKYLKAMKRTEIAKIIENKRGIIFMKQFICLESNKKENFKYIDKMNDKLVCDKFLNLLNEIYDKTPKLNFNINEKYVDDDYHTDNIKNLLPHPDINITEYDKELYKLEHIIGSWKTKLNANKNLLLGAIKINKSDLYNITHISTNTTDTNLYYTNFFNLNIKKDTEKINTIVKDYLTGIYWVFNFYFNRNDAIQNLNSIPIWIYKHERAPLAKEIYNYLKYIGGNIKEQFYSNINAYILENCYKIINSNIYNVPSNKYLTKTEHYLYVTPKKKLVNVEKYNSFIKENYDIYPDTENIVKEIENCNGAEYIDSSRISFINKCHLNIDIIDYNTYVNKLNKYHLR